MRYVCILIMCIFLCSCTSEAPIINRSSDEPMFITGKSYNVRYGPNVYSVSDGSYKWILYSNKVYNIGDEVAIIITSRNNNVKNN